MTEDTLFDKHFTTNSKDYKKLEQKVLTQKQKDQICAYLAGLLERKYIQHICEIRGWEFTPSDANKAIGYEGFLKINGKNIMVEMKRRNFESTKYDSLILEDSKLQTLNKNCLLKGAQGIVYIQSFTDNAFVMFNLGKNLPSPEWRVMNDVTVGQRKKVQKKVRMLKYNEDQIIQSGSWPKLKKQEVIDVVEKHKVKLTEELEIYIKTKIHL